MSRAGLLAGLAVVALAVAPARAQESVFNLPAVGVPESGTGIRGRSLGGAGLALAGPTFSVDNPAQLARFTQAGISLSLLGQRTRVESADESARFDDVVFPMGQLVIPAWSGTAFGLGYYQFVDFDAALETTTEFEGDTIPVTFDSNGGIGVLAPSVSWAPDERIAVGASLDVYLGSRDIVRRVDASNLGTGVIATSDSLSRDFDGLGLTVGVERSFGQARLGAAYHYRPTSTSRITRAPSVDLVGTATEFSLPDEVVAGGSAQLARGLRAAGILRWTRWSEIQASVLDGARLDDALELGGGIEWSPAERAALVLGPAAPLRAGFRWRRLPLILNGARVSEWSATAGYGRGFGGRSRLDVVFEYGRRGTVDTNGLSERFLRLGVGLSTFEPWRQPGR